MKKIRCVYEHSGDDTLLYAENMTGAYARGSSLDAALKKMREEAVSYLKWCGKETDMAFHAASIPLEIVQEKESDLQIRDADSDVIFDLEKGPLVKEEYEALKKLALN